MLMVCSGLSAILRKTARRDSSAIAPRLSAMRAVQYAVGVGLLATASAYSVPTTFNGGAITTRHAAAPTMIIDQLSKAADAAKGAAAEAIISKKVEEKLAKAKEKYSIPAKYEPIMQGLFTSYMTEVYKSGKDTDYCALSPL